jgi:hypothetical protein
MGASPTIINICHINLPINNSHIIANIPPTQIKWVCLVKELRDNRNDAHINLYIKWY